MPSMTKRAIAAELVLRKPRHPSRALARELVAKWPNVFPTIEGARKLVRDVRGVSGKGQRVSPVYAPLKRPAQKSGDDMWEDLMPESWTEPFEDLILPKSLRKILVLSDVHVPYHDPASVALAIKYGRAQKPDAVILNGDTMDLYSNSFHPKDPRKMDWAGEIASGIEFLQMIRDAFPKIPVYFVTGNHERRQERYLMQHAPILLGTDEFELKSLLRMGELGIICVEPQRNVRVGKLNIIHGDNYRGNGGVNPARWLSLRTGEPTLCGHFHRTSAHMDRTIRQDIRGWWSSGCLCELTPEYMRFNQWNHGFCMVHVNPDGTFEVDNKIIVSGKVR